MQINFNGSNAWGNPGTEPPTSLGLTQHPEELSPEELSLKRKREDSGTTEHEFNKKRKVESLISTTVVNRIYSPMSELVKIESSHRKVSFFQDKDIIKIRGKSTNTSTLSTQEIVSSEKDESNQSVFRTNSGRALIQQQTESLSAAYAACVEMLKADRYMSVDWSSTGMGRTDLKSTESIKLALEKHGFVVPVYEEISFEELSKNNFPGLGVIINIKDDHGEHVILLDTINRSEKIALIRDPYRGEAITITLDALKKAVGDSTTMIQTQYRSPPPASKFERHYPPVGTNDSSRGTDDFGEERYKHPHVLSFQDDEILEVLCQSPAIGYTDHIDERSGAVTRHRMRGASSCKTPSGKMVLQQRCCSRGHSTACVEMLKADHGKEIDFNSLCSILYNTGSQKESFNKSGLNVLVQEKVPFEELGNCLNKNGSAIAGRIIIDKIDHSEKTAHIRDSYHGWAIVITLDALKKEFGKFREIIQVVP